MNKILKKSIVFLSLILVIQLQTLSAQAPSWTWAKGFGDTDFDIAQKTTADDSGNVYVTGFYYTSIIFGTGSTAVTLTAQGNEDIYLAKYDASGNLKWATSAGGVNGDEPFGIGVDKGGNVYISGYFNYGGASGDQADFGSTKAKVTLTGDELSDVFVAKYTTTGNIVWARKAGGDGTEQASGFRTDPNGNGYLTGTFDSLAKFGKLSISSNNITQVFTAKISSAGVWQWATASKSSFVSYPESDGIGMDSSGNSYIVGIYYDTIIFGKDTLVTTNINKGGNVFLVKLDKSGNVIWAHSEGGNSSCYPNALYSDELGNLAITGAFYDTLLWDGYTVNSYADQDIFTVKLNSQGNVLWLNEAGGYSYEAGQDVYMDSSGNAFVTGVFYDSAYFGSTNYTGAGEEDVFVAKYTSNGSLKWVQTGGGPNSDGGSGIVRIKNNSVYVTGLFGFDQNNWVASTGTFGSTKLTSAGYFDCFIAKLVDCTPPTATVTSKGGTTICSGDSTILTANSGTSYLYQWYNGTSPISGATGIDLTVKTSGVYSVIVTTPQFCSKQSLSTKITVVSKPNASISAASDTNICAGDSVILSTATGSGYKYQWYKDGKAISGAYSSLFAANSTGKYSVMINILGSCSSISREISVEVKSLPNAIASTKDSTTKCQGDSIKLTANTGNGFSYQWQRNGVDIQGANTSTYFAKAPGGFTVVVSSLKCSSTSNSIQCSFNSAPSATFSSSNLGCTVKLTANASGNTYQWIKDGANITGATNQSFIATLSGDYSLITTNPSGCSTTSLTTKITVNSVDTATITAKTKTTICDGDTVKLEANAGTGYQYQWIKDGSIITGETKQTLSVTNGGGYSVKVSNAGGCNRTSIAMNVIVNNPPAKPTITKNINTLTSSADSGNQWYYNSIKVNGATNKTFKATQNGKYMIVVTDKNGCMATSNQINFTFTDTTQSSIITTGKEIFMNVYPNPTSSKIWVETNLQGQGVISLEDVSGRILKTETLDKTGKTVLDLTNLNSGVYFIKANSSQAVLLVKVIKM